MAVRIETHENLNAVLDKCGSHIKYIKDSISKLSWEVPDFTVSITIENRTNTRWITYKLKGSETSVRISPNEVGYCESCVRDLKQSGLLPDGRACGRQSCIDWYWDIEQDNREAKPALKEGGEIRCSILRNNRTLKSNIISYDDIAKPLRECKYKYIRHLDETTCLDFHFSFENKSGDMAFKSVSFDLKKCDFEKKASVLRQKADIAALEQCIIELRPASGKIGIVSKKYSHRLTEAHVHIVDIKKRIDRKRKRIEALEQEMQDWEETIELQDSAKLTDTERFEACELNNKIDDQDEKILKIVHGVGIRL